MQQASQAHYRLLAADEWTRVAQGLGAVKTATGDGGSGHGPVVHHPAARCFPPVGGMPDGLYRSVVASRAKCQLRFHALSGTRWALMILQIVLGAILTGLGALDVSSRLPVTVLAATQTVVAGLLALLHNSGLPDRYRSNQGEFGKVERHIR